MRSMQSVKHARFEKKKIQHKHQARGPPSVGAFPAARDRASVNGHL